MGAPYNSSAGYLASAIDASLKRLGVEHVALWQIHRPDMLTHPAEAARALEAAHAAGKIGAIGRFQLHRRARSTRSPPCRARRQHPAGVLSAGHHAA